MSSLSPAGRSAAAHKNDRMSLCSFTFSDGRRCRTPRISRHPHFCFYHAQKEARARAAESLGKDLAYFFSGDYLSACDLSTVLARLIPAVLRGDVKPRAARTVAYLAQTLMQAIHISQHEYCGAFSSDAWRKSIRNSVNSNHDYRFPPAPKPEQSQSSQPQPAQPQTQPPQPAPLPHTPMPPTGSDFVQHVVAGQNSSRPPRASRRSSREPDSAANPASRPQPQAQQPASQFAETPVNCHSERSEEPVFSSSPACHAERSEASHPIPDTQSAALQPAQTPEAPTPQTPCPEEVRRVNPREPNRDAPWLYFGDSRHIRPDSKLL